MTNTSLKVQCVKVNEYSLLNIRLWFYSLAHVHLVVTAVVTLSIDVSGDEDPAVRAYSRIRWKLLTTWFNAMLLAYLPLCLYCDWREKQGDEPAHVDQLRVLRDVIMTSILMPVTTFCDILFWLLYRTYPTMIAPLRALDYLPVWAQHSLHTVSMVTVIIDLIVTPRRKPDSMKPRLALMLGYASIYSLTVYVSLLNGEAVYTFLATASTSLHIAMYFCFIGLLTLFYYGQWHLIEYVWGQKGTQFNQKSVKVA